MADSNALRETLSVTNATKQGTTFLNMFLQDGRGDHGYTTVIRGSCLPKPYQSRYIEGNDLDMCCCSQQERHTLQS